MLFVGWIECEPVRSGTTQRGCLDENECQFRDENTECECQAADAAFLEESEEAVEVPNSNNNGKL